MTLCWNTSNLMFKLLAFVPRRYACSMPCSSSNGLSDGTVHKWKRRIQLDPAVWPQLFQVTQEHVPAQPVTVEVMESEAGVMLLESLAWVKLWMAKSLRSWDPAIALCAACPSRCKVEVAWVTGVWNKAFHFIIHSPDRRLPCLSWGCAN